MGVDEELPIHPASNLFPQMEEQDFQVLKADIAQNGLCEPITVYQGQLLDGRFRSRACKELGIELSVREYEGTDPLAFVVSMNLHRRHLKPSQHALIAARLADSKRGGDRSKPQKCGLTHAQAAALLNVGQRLVDKASSLINAESAGGLSPEVLQAVFEGKMSLGGAEKIAELPKEQQTEFLESKNGKAIPRKRRKTNWREQSTGRLEQISVEAERRSSRVVEVIRREHSAGRVTPAQIELALEICVSAEQRFEEASDFLREIARQIAVRPPN